MSNSRTPSDQTKNVSRLLRSFDPYPTQNVEDMTDLEFSDQFQQLRIGQPPLPSHSSNTLDFEENLIDFGDTEPSQEQWVANWSDPIDSNQAYTENIGDWVGFENTQPSQESDFAEEPPVPTQFTTEYRDSSTKSFAEDIALLKVLGFEIHVKPAIGSGSFGDVYAGIYGENALKLVDVKKEPLRNVQPGKPFACKHVDFDSKVITQSPRPVQRVRDSYQVEKTIMNIVDHQNITPFRIAINMGESDTYFNERTEEEYILHKRIYLIMDLADCGPLSLFMVKHRYTLVTNQRIKLTQDCIRGLKYLHDNGIAHGDIHTGNVLIFEDGDGYTAKWADFGMGHFTKDLGPRNYLFISKKGTDCIDLAQVLEDIWREHTLEDQSLRAVCERFSELPMILQTYLDLDDVINQFNDILMIA